MECKSHRFHIGIQIKNKNCPFGVKYLNTNPDIGQQWSASSMSISFGLSQRAPNMNDFIAFLGTRHPMLVCVWVYKVSGENDVVYSDYHGLLPS